MKKGKVLIVINSFNDRESYLYQGNRLKEELENLNIDVDIKKTSELFIYIDGDHINNDEIKKYDLVIFNDKDTLISRMIEKSGVRVKNSSKAIEACDNKFLTHLLLSENGIKMPITFPSLLCYSKDRGIDEKYIEKIEKTIVFPCVFKLNYGSLGANVYLIEDHKMLLEYIEKYKDQSFLIQEYIKESSGTDIRVIVLNNKVIASMLRKNEKDFRSNIGHGGIGYKYEINEKIEEIALKVTKILGLDYCGIDILIKNGEYLICEVNSNAFFQEIEKVSEVNVAKLYAQFISAII